MAFTFPLQTLLRLRLSLEDREWQKLRSLTSEVERARSAIESVATSIAGAHISRTLAEEAHSAAELQHATACAANLGKIRENMLSKLADLERRREQQREIYRQVRQNREVLESLRDQQLARWTLEESRRQQNAADDLYLLRRAHAR